MSKDYEEHKAKLKEEQTDKSYDEIKQTMQERSEHLVELDHMIPQEHRWVDRGLVMSCEGAAHPNHRSFKRR
jgi:hypothetical protein